MLQHDVDLLGGYYVIEQARLQLHLVALNTNFYSEQNVATTESDDLDPAGQWAWLEGILLKARRRRGTVRIQSTNISTLPSIFRALSEHFQSSFRAVFSL